MMLCESSKFIHEARRKFTKLLIPVNVCLGGVSTYLLLYGSRSILPDVIGDIRSLSHRRSLLRESTSVGLKEVGAVYVPSSISQNSLILVRLRFHHSWRLVMHEHYLSQRF